MEAFYPSTGASAKTIGRFALTSRWIYTLRTLCQSESQWKTPIYMP